MNLKFKIGDYVKGNHIWDFKPNKVYQITNYVENRDMYLYKMIGSTTAVFEQDRELFEKRMYVIPAYGTPLYKVLND